MRRVKISGFALVCARPITYFMSKGMWIFVWIYNPTSHRYSAADETVRYVSLLDVDRDSHPCLTSMSGSFWLSLERYKLFRCSYRCKR